MTEGKQCKLLESASKKHTLSPSSEEGGRNGGRESERVRESEINTCLCGSTFVTNNKAAGGTVDATHDPALPPPTHFFQSCLQLLHSNSPNSLPPN